jgi:hypothetical protein
MAVEPRDVTPTRGSIRLVWLIVGALPLAGCGREFFREWANQDASEVVFEKSRDPRWRLDMFSIEPPAMSRFANPYDPDFPPAPPDDYATEAMSPVPQWPDHRLLVPTEGTGYEDMLEAWAREQPQTSPVQTAPPPTLPQPRGVPPLNAPPPATGPSPFAPRTAGRSIPAGSVDPEVKPVRLTQSPGASRETSAQTANSGTKTGKVTPKLVSGTSAAPKPDGITKADAPRKDLGVRLAAFQDTGIPLPVPAPGVSSSTPPTQPNQTTPAPATQPGTVPLQETVPVPLVPNPISSDLTQPVNPRQPGQTEEEYRAGEAATAEMSPILAPGATTFDEAAAAGLPPGSKPYVINPAQALTLALINSRAYQYQLESLYIAALAVTLQRFQFEPQFIFGMSPVTATSAGLPANLSNAWLYRTKYAPGGQASTLNLGTVAGFGKVFNSGARLVAGFANQLVFNFTGINSRQPLVQSQLPLTFVQPFLAGGGRAVTLEALTLAERNMVYAIRLFARFRQEFFVTVLAGQSTLTNPGLNDPIIGYLQVLLQLQQVENDRRNIATISRYLEVFEELAKGESSGLTQLQIDQVNAQLQNSYQGLLNDENQYRNFMDQYKQQLGLPPDVPVVVDRAIIKDFRRVFDQTDLWSANPRREIAELPAIISQVPALRDVQIDGRSVLDVAGVYKPGEPIPADTALQKKPQIDKLEDLLLAAERIMLENRLDLMNARAQLYDAWRQLRVTANALKGVLDVTITNQFLTPANTTNPFGFLDQSKQFSLVLNWELPLVRLSQRNNFRTAIINYERQRRALMNAEDTLKFTIRAEIRNLILQAQTYEIAKRRFVLYVRQKDQAQEQLIAPPAGAAGVGQVSQAAVQVQNLLGAQGNLLQSQSFLISTWINYETQRFSLYKDLGIMPYDEWEAYYELFAPNLTGEQPGGRGGNAPGAGVGPAAVPAALAAPTPGR